MKLGTQTGSLVNHLMTTSDTGKQPKVGDGVTICGWTDRTPATIIKLSSCTITVQEDNFKRTDNNGMSESQTYEYSANPDGNILIFRKTKKGWTRKGYSLSLCGRNRYYDYSF
jgi:hypothetical protein